MTAAWSTRYPTENRPISEAGERGGRRNLSTRRRPPEHVATDGWNPCQIEILPPSHFPIREEIEASFRGPPDEPAEPTDAEIAAAPDDIERICQTCLKPFMVNHFFAEKFSPENPWNICGRCFDYAGKGDLTLEEEARFPVPPLTPEMRKKVREDNARLDKNFGRLGKEEEIANRRA